MRQLAIVVSNVYNKFLELFISITKYPIAKMYRWECRLSSSLLQLILRKLGHLKGGANNFKTLYSMVISHIVIVVVHIRWLVNSLLFGILR